MSLRWYIIAQPVGFNPNPPSDCPLCADLRSRGMPDYGHVFLRPVETVGGDLGFVVLLEDASGLDVLHGPVEPDEHGGFPGLSDLIVEVME